MKIHWTYWNISKLGSETKFYPIFSKHNKITLSLLTKKTLMHELPRARNKRVNCIYSFIPLNTLIQKPSNINRKLHQQFIKSLQESHRLSGLWSCKAGYFFFSNKLQFFEKASLFTSHFLFLMTLYPDSRTSPQTTLYSSVKAPFFLSLRINCHYVLHVV